MVEGPWMVHRDELYYLFYSGGTFTNATYGLGYAYGTSPAGPFTKDAQLLGTIPLVIGPGGASLIGRRLGRLPRPRGAGRGTDDADRSAGLGRAAEGDRARPDDRP